MRRAPGGGSSGCSCGEVVAVHLRPQLSRISVNLLLRGSPWTSRTAANAIMTAWQRGGQGFESPQLHPSEQAIHATGQDHCDRRRTVPRDLRPGEQPPQDVQCGLMYTGRGVLGVQSAVDEPGERFGGHLDVW
jgi:hypothetical protein